MTAVPVQYQGWVRQAAANTGLPQQVVAAQINEESGFNPRATSPTGAEGIAQIEPATAAGLGPGSPYDPNVALADYSKDMRQLLAQFHGNVRDALAAYNAGAGNLPAGYGYADKILSAAGQPNTVTAGNPSAAPAGGSGGLSAALTAIETVPGLSGIAIVGGGVLLLAVGLWVSGGAKL